MKRPIPLGTPSPYSRPHRPEPIFPPVPLPEPGPAARFPLTVSADRRRFLDADGMPFLIQGDAAWSIVANLTYEQAVHYLDDRRAKGFNTVIINLIEHLFSRDPPRDLAGREPFTTPGDMSTPNDAYFDAAERVLDACAERGFMVLLAPCYIGYERDFGDGGSLRLEGWNDEIVATGPEGCRVYGEYLGRRFGHFANIVWMIGGDWHPLDARSGLDAIAEGIRAHGREEPLHRPSASGVLADRILRRVELARRQRHLHLRHRASLAHRRLAAQSAVAVLPDRVGLRGRAQRQPPCRFAGRPIGRCFAAATATAWATTRSGFSGTAGSARSIFRAPSRWPAGATSSAVCRGASSSPTSSSSW